MDDRLITLTGENFNSYQAGLHYGSATAFKDSSDHLRKLERHFKHKLALVAESVGKALPEDHPMQQTLRDLPNMSGTLTMTAEQLKQRAIQHSAEGARHVGQMNASVVVSETVVDWHKWLTVGLGASTIILALAYALAMSR